VETIADEQTEEQEKPVRQVLASAIRYEDIRKSTSVISAPVPSTITIQTVTVGDISGGGATAIWGTNISASSRVEYGVVSGARNLFAITSGYTQFHSVSLSGLSAGTTYYYKVISATSDGGYIESVEKSFVAV
jgi:hypothetical protein